MNRIEETNNINPETKRLEIIRTVLNKGENNSNRINNINDIKMQPIKKLYHFASSTSLCDHELIFRISKERLGRNILYKTIKLKKSENQYKLVIISKNTKNSLNELIEILKTLSKQA